MQASPGCVMAVSVGPHTDNAGPVATWPPPPVSVKRDRRVGRRVLGVIAFVAAGIIEMFHMVALYYMTQYEYEQQWEAVVNPLFGLECLVLLVGFTMCLVGTSRALRVAVICAAIFFCLVVAEEFAVVQLTTLQLNAEMSVEDVYGGKLTDAYKTQIQDQYHSQPVGMGLLITIPGLILLPGIFVMNPRIWAKMVPPLPEQDR